jgi:hypothetical protein
VVDALERIHAALAPGGVVVDTQPVSADPPVVGEGGPLGALDMSEWSRTIAAVDEQIMHTVEGGLFAVTAERMVVVTDVYDDLAELVTVTREWVGTWVPPELARRARTERGPVRLDQEIRLRILAAK